MLSNRGIAKKFLRGLARIFDKRVRSLHSRLLPAVPMGKSRGRGRLVQNRHCAHNRVLSVMACCVNNAVVFGRSGRKYGRADGVSTTGRADDLCTRSLGGSSAERTYSQCGGTQVLDDALRVLFTLMQRAA